MPYNPEIHHRRSIRLRGYDYTSPGAYFITICTHQRQSILGEVIEGQMNLNPLGQIAYTCWIDLPNHYPNVALDQFIIMPNHIHGIILLTRPTTASTQITPKPTAPTDGNQPGFVRPGFVRPGFVRPGFVRPGFVRPGFVRAGFKPAQKGPAQGKSHALPEIIRAFKTFSARRVNEHRATPSIPLWHRNYYEHIIRDDEELDRIRQYITENPVKWSLDQDNPAIWAIEPAYARDSYGRDSYGRDSYGRVSNPPLRGVS